MRRTRFAERAGHLRSRSTVSNPFRKQQMSIGHRKAPDHITHRAVEAQPRGSCMSVRSCARAVAAPAAVADARRPVRGDAWLQLADLEVSPERSAAAVRSAESHGSPLFPGPSCKRRHRTFVEIERDSQSRSSTGGSLSIWLCWLRMAAEPWLSADLTAAAERLRRDFEIGQLQPRITANWSASVSDGRRSGDGSGTKDLTDMALAARLRFDRAMRDVGPELSGVLIDICCFLKGLETVERERRWPARSAKLGPAHGADEPLPGIMG